MESDRPCRPTDLPPSVFDEPLELVQVKLKGDCKNGGDFAQFLMLRPPLVLDIASLLAPHNDAFVYRIRVSACVWEILTQNQSASDDLTKRCSLKDAVENLKRLFDDAAEVIKISLESKHVTTDRSFNDIRIEAEDKMEKLRRTSMEQIDEVVFSLSEVTTPSGATVFTSSHRAHSSRSTSSSISHKPRSSVPTSTPSVTSPVNVHVHPQTETKLYHIENAGMVNIGATDMETSPTKEEEELTEEAIESVLKAQKDYDISDITLQGIPVSANKIPKVHPRMVEFDFYNENASGTDIYLPSEDEARRYLKYGKPVSYEKLLKYIVAKYDYICLCGFPGAGKTTLTRRLKRSLQQLDKKYVCFLINLNETNYPDNEKLILRKVLLDKSYPNLDSATCEDAFKWIRKHDDQCVIILDGYDKAKWKMTEVPPMQDYDTPLPIHEIMANICKKHFLPRARVVLASRPHTLITIPNGLKPKFSVILQDLHTADMKDLLFAFAESAGEKMWESMNKTAASLKSFCLNPLMLQLYVRASRRSLQESDDMLTMTRIFSAVLTNMKRSESSTNRDIESMSDQLSRLAFNATNESRVCISIDELKQENLKADDVQDLMPAFQDNLSLSNKKHYFTHQTIQEYFAARYIMLLMPLEIYHTFLKEQLFTDRWYVVRRYLCGLMVDINDDAFSQSNLLKTIFKVILGSNTKESITSQKKTALLEGIKSQLINKNPDQRDLVFICHDVRECNNAVVTEAAADCFPRRVLFFNTPLAASDAHAVGFVLSHVTGKIEELLLWNSNLRTSSFTFICDAIKKMPGTVSLMDLRFNNLDTDGAVKLGEIVHKIEDQLLLNEGFVDETGTNRNANEKERKILQTALNQVEDSKLKILVDIQGGERIYLQKEA